MSYRRPPLRFFRLIAAVLGVATATAGFDLRAQEARHDARTEAPQRPQADSISQRLPPDTVTHHTVDLADRKLSFTATAGSIPLTNQQGRILAEIAYIHYALDGTDLRQRPVTFAFNGGPGSSSSWLHVGTLGPWRLPIDEGSIAPSAPVVLTPNAETWLDFTDLVFIDPVGTGYSQIAAERIDGGGNDGNRRGSSGADEGSQRHFWSVDGDADSIAEFMQKWLQKSGRLTSPKMLVGESYGGFRGPKVARKLQEKYGVGLNALVLISPVLDFAGRRGGPLPYVSVLPSLAAAAIERRGGQVERQQQKPIEEYARTEYLNDLMRGPRDSLAVDRMVAKIAEATGLPIDTVRHYGGRISGSTYNREINRADGKTASLYDATITGLSENPTSPNPRNNDPLTSGLAARLTTAMLDLYTTKLGWRADRRYINTNGEANRAWNWGNSTSSPEAVSDLRQALALDPRLRVVVAHGFTDLVTPYFGSQLVLDELPALGDMQRVATPVYPGGHMFYIRDASRKAFREDAMNLIERVIVEMNNGQKAGQ
jgi:carboxypeptidase C (cathepsin A)